MTDEPHPFETDNAIHDWRVVPCPEPLSVTRGRIYQDDPNAATVAASIRISVSVELLRQFLRLPDVVTIHGLEVDGQRGAVTLLAEIPGAPFDAATMEPIYSRSNGWPDPIHLHEIVWRDGDGQAIEVASRA